jgi:signal peptidase I
MAATAQIPEGPSWVRTVVIGRNPKRTLVRIVVMVVTCFITAKFVLLPIRVEGVSMLPTYKGRGINFINRLAFVFHEPRRGDVVAVRLAGEHVMFLKRIVGLPGDTVAWHGGQLIINGEPMDEPYVKFPCYWETQAVKDGPNQYYVVGDNRSMAPQDHEQGRAERKRIVGKTLL